MISPPKDPPKEKSNSSHLEISDFTISNKLSSQRNSQQESEQTKHYLKSLFVDSERLEALKLRNEKRAAKQRLTSDAIARINKLKKALGQKTN